MRTSDDTNKAFRTVMLLPFLVLGLWGCTNRGEPASDTAKASAGSLTLTAPPQIDLTAADNGRTVEVSRGQTVVISLGGNPSIPGSGWSMETLDGQSVEQVGTVECKNWRGRPMPGGMSCDFIFTFRAVRAGKSVIRIGRPPLSENYKGLTVTVEVKGEAATQPATDPASKPNNK